MSRTSTFGRIKVRFPKNSKGELGRIEFEHDFDNHEQSEVSAIIEKMFLNGLAVLCNQCRHAKTELTIAWEQRDKCGNYIKRTNECAATEKTCDMSCELVVGALNEYRKK